MTQNLDLGENTDMTLNAETTDLHPEATGGTSEFILKKSSSPWSYTYTASEMYDPGDYYIANGTASSYTSTSSLAQDATEWHWHQGNYYNWYAATAGSDASSLSANQESVQSICPKGWRLPYSGTTQTGSKSFYDLKNKAGLTASNITASPYYFPRAGYYYTGVDYLGSGGYYWSSTAYGGSGRYYGAYELYFNSSNVNPQDYDLASNGDSVRCVAR